MGGGGHNPRNHARVRIVLLVLVMVIGAIVGTGERAAAVPEVDPSRGLPDWVADAASSRSRGPEPLPWEESPSAPAAERPRAQDPPPEPEFPEAAAWDVDLGAAGAPAAVAADTLEDLGVEAVEELPVVVSSGSDAAAGSSAVVEVLDHDAAERVGIPGFVFTVTPSDAPAAAERAAPETPEAAAAVAETLPTGIDVDYSGFAQAYGGDFGARLRIVALPDCVLEDPIPEHCNTSGVPLPTTNDTATQRLQVNVDDVRALAAGVHAPAPADRTGLPDEVAEAMDADGAGSENGSMAVFAVAADTDSDAGTYRATQLTPSGRWNVSGGTGDFTYSVPISTPSTAGGTPPTVGLSYSSGAVDGLTLATNSQTTQVGLGWSDFANAFIERSYEPCRVAGVFDYGDLCWSTDNATISLNGVSGSLVPVNEAKTEWRAVSDPNWKIERDDQANYTDTWGTQHWKVTAPDGTVYHFGFGHMPGRQTGSILKVPVFGDHPGEPCSDTVNVPCYQAWRWYLDRVEDPNGNVQSLIYKRETNNYRPWNGYMNWRAEYDRGASLAEIIYGGDSSQWNPDFFGARVIFDTQYRCASLDTSCTTHPANNHPAGTWIDVPNDQVCSNDPAHNCNTFSPTFFSAVRYSAVKTQVKVGTAWTTVNQYNLSHEYPADDPAVRVVRKLQLKSIQETDGAATNPDKLPATQFGYAWTNNRADHDGNINTALRHNRLTAITTSLGNKIAVSYWSRDNCRDYTTSRWDQNTKACFPQSIMKPDNSGWREGVFIKYLVTRVVETPDASDPGSAIQTDYQYEGDPAWGQDLSAFARGDLFKSWTRWLGFDTTVTTNGTTTTRTRHHRGFDNDLEIQMINGQPCVCKFRDIKVDVGGVLVDDHQALAGRTIEEIEYGTVDGVPNTIAESTLYTYKVAPTFDLHGDYENSDPTWAAVESVIESAAADSGESRQRSSTTTYNDNFQAISTLEVGWDEQTETRCARTTYANNPDRFMWSYPATNQLVAGGCDSTQVLTSSEIYYDGATPAQTQPLTTGNPTLERTLVDAGAGTWAEMATTYDGFGRPTEVTDARGNGTTMSYTPTCVPKSGGGCEAYTSVQAPVTSKTTNALQHTLTTDWNTRFGLPATQTDANGNKTTLTYDVHGRTKTVRLPTEQGTSLNSWEFFYDVANRVVRSRQLTAGSGSSATYEDTWVIYDGLWRERQVQTVSPASTTEAPKTVVAETTYDGRGLLEEERVAQALNGSPGQILTGGSGFVWKNRTQYAYDELGRETAEHWWRDNAVAHTTTTSYSVDEVMVTGPGADDQRVQSRHRVDGLGRTVAVDEFDGQDWVGATYRYDLADNLIAHTAAGGAEAGYGYNNAGWRTLMLDANRGLTTYGYDLAGNQTSVNPYGATSVHILFDELNRPEERRSGSLTGTLQAKWEYDATNEKGLLDSSTSYDTSNRAWKTDVTGYDPAGRPKGTKLSIPSGVSGFASDYTVTQTYDRAGRVASTKLPAIGGLAEETLSTAYTTFGLPSSYSGLTNYVNSVNYDDRGRPEVMSLGPAGGYGWMLRWYAYDADQRPSEVRSATWNGTVYQQVAQHTIGYRDDGQVKERTTALNGAQNRECFQYDPRARLTEAYTVAITANCETPEARGTGDMSYNDSYRYSPAGDLTERIENGVSTTYDYPDPGTGAPNTPTEIGPGQYQWDSQGRLQQRTVGSETETYTWDATGQLTEVDGPEGETSFVYDAEGQRLLRTSPAGTTLYFAGHEATVPASGGAAEAVRSYVFNGELIATRTADGVDYLTSDGSGSVNMAVPSGGTPNAVRAYRPYGSERSATGSTDTDRGFLGQPEDESTKLSYLNARYYDATSGIFLSPDPIVNTANIKSLNPYSYSYGSPATLSDPSGMAPNLQRENRNLRAENSRLRLANRNLLSLISHLQDIIDGKDATIIRLLWQNAALRLQLLFQKAVNFALKSQIGTLKMALRISKMAITALQKKVRAQARVIDFQAQRIRGLSEEVQRAKRYRPSPGRASPAPSQGGSGDRVTTPQGKPPAFNDFLSDVQREHCGRYACNASVKITAVHSDWEETKPDGVGGAIGAFGAEVGFGHTTYRRWVSIEVQVGGATIEGHVYLYDGVDCFAVCGDSPGPDKGSDGESVDCILRPRGSSPIGPNVSC